MKFARKHLPNGTAKILRGSFTKCLEEMWLTSLWGTFFCFQSLNLKNNCYINLFLCLTFWNWFYLFDDTGKSHWGSETSEPHWFNILSLCKTHFFQKKIPKTCSFRLLNKNVFKCWEVNRSHDAFWRCVLLISVFTNFDQMWLNVCPTNLI